METSWKDTSVPVWNAPPDGFELGVQDIVGAPAAPGQRHDIKDFARWRGTLLALASTRQGKSYVLGSAAMVGPGLALTAAHVVEEILGENNANLEETSVVALAPVDDRLLIWAVRRCTHVLNSDLAILELTLRSKVESPFTINVLRMSTRSPEVGETTLGVGFRSAELEYTAPSYRMALFEVTGSVLDVYDTGAGIAKSASFCVDFPTVGGMSGGPVFNSSGRLIAIISSGFDEVSRASIIRPALATEIQPEWPPSFYKEPIRILDSRYGTFVDEPDRVTVTINPLTGEKVLSYRHRP